MDITRLTIQGFKSFYEKSVFDFGANITGIVGPNGSGKSNITEAIRFALGEQSTKSIRGKEITDLLFRGNSMRASKAVVTIEFKNNQTQKILSSKNLENIFVKNILEKGEVSLSRTLFADGKSVYSMNGVEVRLKDVNEFLLHIHLGNKSSWHISQGEADRVLLSNPADRKTLIEDALGLKIYHSRINDSLKKLEKTNENIRTASLNRKELGPELKLLERQVEKIKKSNDYRLELVQKAQKYLNLKELEVKSIGEYDPKKVASLEVKRADLTSILADKQAQIYKTGSHDTSHIEHQLEKEEKVNQILNEEKSQLESQLRVSENNLQYLTLEETKNSEEVLRIETEINSISKQGNDVVFAERDVQATRTNIELESEKIINTNSLEVSKTSAKEISFVFNKLVSLGAVVNKDNVQQITYLQTVKTRAQEKLKEIKKDKQKFLDDINTLKPQIESLNLRLQLSNAHKEELKKQIYEFKYLKSETERDIEKTLRELSDLEQKIREQKHLAEKIEMAQRELEVEKIEFVNILGKNFQDEAVKEHIDSSEDIFTLKRSIEKLKIRLEESMVTNPEEIIQNFNQLTERDNFLMKEIEDL